MSYTSLVSYPFPCAVSLFLSSSGVSHRISEYPGRFHHGQPGPGSGPRPVDLQHGGCGHWEGGCSAPTHPAAFTTLPRECLPSLPRPPRCPWLPVCEPGVSWAVMEPSLPCSSLSLCTQLPRMFSRPGSVYLTSQSPGSPTSTILCCSPFLVWPFAQQEHGIELGGDTPLDLCSSIFSPD